MKTKSNPRRPARALRLVQALAQLYFRARPIPGRSINTQARSHAALWAAAEKSATGIEDNQ